MNASTPDDSTPVPGTQPPPPPQLAVPATPEQRSKPEREKPARGTPHEVRFVAYPKLLFVWPLLLAGLLFYPLSAWSWVSPGTLGWIYVWAAVVVLMTLGVDIDRNMFVFWLVVFAAFWILGLWLKDVRGITIFGDIYRWFGSLRVEYHRGLGLALSIILLIPYVLMLLWARLNDRWRITHNEFEHFAFGKMDDSLGRGAKTIRTSFPDVLELLLGLAGTLVVYNATGTKELRRIPHVMFLPFIRQRLNKILEKTAITDFAAAEEEEDEDQS